MMSAPQQTGHQTLCTNTCHIVSLPHMTWMECDHYLFTVNGMSLHPYQIAETHCHLVPETCRKLNQALRSAVANWWVFVDGLLVFLLVCFLIVTGKTHSCMK